jgi:hypothetical protein
MRAFGSPPRTDFRRHFLIPPLSTLTPPSHRSVSNYLFDFFDLSTKVFGFARPVLFRDSCMQATEPGPVPLALLRTTELFVRI